MDKEVLSLGFEDEISKYHSMRWHDKKGGKMDKVIQELKSFMNEGNQLVALPGKYKKKLIAYYYLASKIETGKRYTESDINDILNQWAIFRDPATLRRELYNKHLLNRTEDGKFYWKEEELPLLEDFIAKYI